MVQRKTTSGSFGNRQSIKSKTRDNPLRYELKAISRVCDGDRWLSSWQAGKTATYSGEYMSFDIFWAQYPRRVARPVANRAWDKLTKRQQQDALEALPKHISFWAETTEKQFIPYPASWLNQQRFYDELEIDQPKQQAPKLIAWWTSDAGILAKGKELGLEPRPGETMYTFKDRVAEQSRRAA